MEISSSFQNVWSKPTSTGRIISVTGVFADISGGDIVFLHISVMNAEKW